MIVIARRSNFYAVEIVMIRKRKKGSPRAVVCSRENFTYATGCSQKKENAIYIEENALNHDYNAQKGN